MSKQNRERNVADQNFGKQYKWSMCPNLQIWSNVGYSVGRTHTTVGHMNTATVAFETWAEHIQL